VRIVVVRNIVKSNVVTRWSGRIAGATASGERLGVPAERDGAEVAPRAASLRVDQRCVAFTATVVAASGRQPGGHADGSDTGHIAAIVERALALDLTATLAVAVGFAAAVVAPIGQGPGQQIMSDGEHWAAATKGMPLFFAPRLAAWPGTTANAPTAIASTATDRMDLIENSL
jgi:hypothetical protein